MILGIGCDLVNIARIELILARHEERFLHRIYHPLELQQMPEAKARQHSYLAKRFAAKEAFAKAIGTGIGAHLSFAEISATNNAHGQPILKCWRHLPHLPSYRVHLSLADDYPFAMAYVVVETS